MSDIEQQESSTGILITRVRGYRLFNAIFFAGRRSKLDRALAREADPRPGDRVLDIGCGPGNFTSTLGATVGSGGSVVGIDPSNPMVEHATARSTGNNVHFERGAAQELPYADESFDVVTSTFVMHHIPEACRGDALAEMYRVLRPGGSLLLADMFPLDPIRTGLVRALSVATTHRGRHEGVEESDPFESVDVHRYIAPLESAGFEEIRFRPVKPSTGCLLARKPA
ncbi:MAG: methyltransferase domain-containing protein [Rhodococcus sp.]|nr:methyltransferase domain-containing protein [Rhodococcus sp. (in: high G+C Gram-positive bacteria)]